MARSGSMYNGMLKAALIAEGSIELDTNPGIGYICRDTAGPHGNRKTIFIEFGRHRVKLEVGNSRFRISEQDNRYILFENSKPVTEVKFVKPVFHAPEMAFFNLIPGCKYNCAFCNLAGMSEGIERSIPLEKYIELVQRRGKEIASIAVTSGVIDVERDIQMIGKFTQLARKAFPSIPLGVEPFITKKSHIDFLRECGADEIKINVHLFNETLLKKWCPAFDRDPVPLLEHAVNVFGAGNVCTNVLLGLGEREEETIEGLEMLAELGVLASLRVVRNTAVGIKIKPDVVYNLAQEYETILKRYNLKPSMKTMCLRCMSCDLVPGADL